MIAQKKLKTRDIIIAAIGNLPEWFATPDIVKITGISTNPISSALGRMVDSDELERKQTNRNGKNGVMYWYRATAKLGKRERRSHQVEPKVVDMSAVNIFVEIMKKGHDEDFVDKLPAVATGAIPGSPEKVEVMRQRVERGESPNHPGDLRGGSQLGAIPRFAIRVSGVGGIREVGA